MMVVVTGTGNKDDKNHFFFSPNLIRFRTIKSIWYGLKSFFFCVRVCSFGTHKNYYTRNHKKWYRLNDAQQQLAVIFFLVIASLFLYNSIDDCIHSNVFINSGCSNFLNRRQLNGLYTQQTDIGHRNGKALLFTCSLTLFDLNLHKNTLCSTFELGVVLFDSKLFFFCWFFYCSAVSWHAAVSNQRFELR